MQSPHAWRYSPEDRLWSCARCGAESESCPHPTIAYSAPDRFWICHGCGREWSQEPERGACAV